MTLPDAFRYKNNFPVIRKTDDYKSLAATLRPADMYKMGKIVISIMPEFDGLPFMASINHPSRLPTWDEVVWIRYNLMPDNLDIAFILPPINEYINHDSGRAKYTFTMEAVKRHIQE